MKNLRMRLFAGIFGVLVLAGCVLEAGQTRGNPLGPMTPQEPVTPHLYVFLEPGQGVQAIGLNTSWTVFDEDGNFVVGFDSDSPHPLQLGLRDFYSATLQLSHVQDSPLDWRFIGLDFTLGYPPNAHLPHIISVTRWRVEHTGEWRIDVFPGEETVELMAPGGWTPGPLAEMIPIFDDGFDYIYAVQAEWREGRSQGTKLFAFRVISGVEHEVIVPDVPARSPRLYVSLRAEGVPAQNFRAGQGTTSWFHLYEASGEHPLDFWEEMWECIDFSAFRGRFADTGRGEIELLFSHFPPDRVYVRRWRAEFIGMVSEMWNRYERVELNDNIIRISDSGYDYIYKIEARWVLGDFTDSSAKAFYTFRIDSAG